MIEPLIVVAALIGMIGLGAPIFLALGASGLLGLYMARGSLAFFFAPKHGLLASRRLAARTSRGEKQGGAA